MLGPGGDRKVKEPKSESNFGLPSYSAVVLD